MIIKRDDFRASDGWLDKFKKIFGIRFLTITGEKLSCDLSAVDPFVRKFQEFQELGLGPEQVYNADESGLFWRLFPTKRLSTRLKKVHPGAKWPKTKLHLWEPSMGTSHRLPKPVSKQQLVVSNNHNNTGIVTSGFYIESSS
jgi:hypothetical protein